MNALEIISLRCGPAWERSTNIFFSVLLFRLHELKPDRLTGANFFAIS